MMSTGRTWPYAVGLLLAVGACGAIAGGTDEESVGDRYGAEVACEDWVKDRLKSPATAKFSEVTVTGPDAGPWTATGVLDSENSFGAMVRSSFRCEVRSEDGETYRGRAVVK